MADGVAPEGSAAPASDEGAVAMAAQPGGQAQQMRLPPGVTVEQFKKWVIIYPAYLDLEATVAQGRRVPKSKLEGCYQIIPPEILAAARALGFQSMIELNRYPRNVLMPGRVRVELKKPDGSLAVPSIPTKEKLLVELARTIPTTDFRKSRLAQVEGQRRAYMARMEEQKRYLAMGKDERREYRRKIQAAHQEQQEKMKKAMAERAKAQAQVVSR